jgi:ATP-binding cassette, subfamily F, member 3
MLILSEVVYRIDKRPLIDRASASIPDGAKVGLVGRNGAGKSTLLDLIRGALQPDDGTIEVPRGQRIGFLAQAAPGGTATAYETVLAADRERARLLAERDAGPEPLRAAEIEARLVEIGARSAPARAAGILAGLGLDAASQQEPLDRLSGGSRMRAALAALLFAEPDLLLLDEPTNHLDLEAALWLERFLRGYRHTLILVSHDRQILNAVTTTTLHLERGRLTLYSGNFDAFVRASREKLQRLEVLARHQADERARLQAFIDRFRAKASKARQVQSRLKALARFEPIALAAEAPPSRLGFPEPPRLRPPLLTLDRVSVGYVPGKPVLSRLDLRLDPEDRVALLGANGNGKTTLARLLAGRLAPLGGHVIRHPRLRCGYFAQHQLEEMRPEASAYEHLAAAIPDALPEAVRARLGNFGFSREKAFVPVAGLSGGERAKLNFALVTRDAPALLILDEPTNHLDLETREELVRSLNEFAGAVVVVTHDWHLLELVADQLWIVADGTVRAFEGDLDEYRRQLLEGGPGSEARHAAEPDPRRAARRVAAAERRLLEPLRQRARQAEEKVARLVAERNLLDRRLSGADGTSGSGPATVAALKSRAELLRAIAEAEGEWFAAEEELDGVARREVRRCPGKAEDRPGG